MTQTIASLWNGKIAPCGQCGAQDIEANHLIDLMERNRESLLRELTDAQKDTFQKYIDCSEDYLLRMLELAFCDGFRFGGKLVTEALL